MTNNTNHYGDPVLSPEFLTDPVFNAIWNEIKSWDINVPEEYEGYCGATGNHVSAIFRAIHSVHEPNHTTHKKETKSKEKNVDKVAVNADDLYWLCTHIPPNYVGLGQVAERLLNTSCEIEKSIEEKLGEVVLKYWDRLNDPVPDDPRSKITDEMIEELDNVFNPKVTVDVRDLERIENHLLNINLDSSKSDSINFNNIESIISNYLKKE